MKQTKSMSNIYDFQYKINLDLIWQTENQTYILINHLFCILTRKFFHDL